jgi:hypothetical protein
MCPIPNGFRDKLFHSTVAKLSIRKRYYWELCLIPVFIVQVTKMVQFTQCNTFSKIPPSTSMHFATCVRATYSVFGICGDIRHSYNVSINSHNGQLTLHTNSHAGGKDNIGRQIHTTAQWNFWFRMTDTMTSQNTDLPPLDTYFALLWKYYSRFLKKRFGITDVIIRYTEWPKNLLTG